MLKEDKTFKITNCSATMQNIPLMFFSSNSTLAIVKHMFKSLKKINKNKKNNLQHKVNYQ